MTTVNQKGIARVYNRAIRRLLGPPHCPLCHTPMPGGAPLCHYCEVALTPARPPLCRCGLSAALEPADAATPELCGRCIRRPPPFSGVWPAFVYAPPLDRLIHEYKHRGRLARERTLVRLWQARLDTAPPPPVDALIPLPCHWRRHWMRGFSQPERLAGALGRYLDLPLHRALIRARATPAQQGLSRAERERNLKQAFRCIAAVKGLRLALVDDVLTTGSSARVASRVLLDAGAERVDLWVLARTPPRR